MPELPEVETIRLQLDRFLPGLRITGVEVLDRKSFIGGIREIGEIRGRRVRGVERRGKMIIIRLSEKKNLLIHLKLTGQLIYREGNGGKGGEKLLAVRELPNKFTRVIISFDNSGRLYFNDLRKFGWIKIVKSDPFGKAQGHPERSRMDEKLKVQSEISELGVEPFSKEFTSDYLRQIFTKTARPAKLVLMDQTKIAGIGNIYANEALFEAEISPAKPAKKLRNLEIEKLREGIIRVLEEGLKYGGASAADEAYVKPSGTPGSYQEHFRVYQREGQKCLRCGGAVKRVNLGGRGTFYCEKCQK